MEELLTTIESTNNSSPGPDNIPNILIKNLPTLRKEVLIDVYSYIWTKRVFPKIWKMAIVVPVAKPGKDPSKSDNYRPISLTCNMCKILEKIVNKRLRWFLGTQKIINDNQFGFRSGHSTMSHLISVDSQIQEAFMNNQHVIAVSLDIEKAYDMVWKRRILKILQIIGIKGNMYDIIKNFSLDRKLQVRINGQLSDIKQIENGVPQGSVLSVTLFLLSINDIDKGVQPPVIIRKYADDITVLCKGKSVPSTQKTMQKALNTIFEWSLSTGFKFSAKKTECMFFSKRIDTVSPKLQLGTQPLRFVNKMKILGQQFDPKLTWKIHIQELIMECKKRLNVIKCLSNNNWGADKNLLLLTYKAIIRSKIDYGSLLYRSANKKELRKIESIHNKGLRICTGCFHTTPTGSILIEAQETSLNHRRKTLNLKYAAKAASFTNPIIHNDIFPQLQNIYNSHFRYKPMYSRITQQLKELNIKSISAEKHRQLQIPPWTIEKMTLELSLTDYNNSNLTKEDWNTQFKEVIQKYKNYSHFYIRNKNSEQDTEAIVYTPNEKFSFLLHHYCSSNSTESYALMTALKMIHQSLDSNIIVFTNSLYNKTMLQQNFKL